MNKTMKMKKGITFSGTYMESGHEVSYTLGWYPMSDERWERRLRYQFKKRNCSVRKSRGTGLYQLVDNEHPYPDYEPWNNLTLEDMQGILERIVESEN